MAAEKVGAVIVYGQGVVGSYGSFTSLSGIFPSLKGQYLVIPAEGKPLVGCRSADDAATVENAYDDRVATFHAEDASELPELVGSVAFRLAGEAGAPRVGLAPHVSRGLGRDDYDRIESRSGPLVDCVEMVATARAAKDPADLPGLRDTVRILDASLESLDKVMGAGMAEWDAAGILQGELTRRGVLTSLVFVSGGPFYGQPPTDRLLRTSDVATVLVEAANRDGYWAEVGTVWIGSDVPQRERDAVDRALAVARESETTLRAGASVRDFASELSRRLNEVGSSAPVGLGHGVGIDEDGPTIALETEASVDSGQFVSIHPTIVSPSSSLRYSFANTVVITPNAGRPLSTTPHHPRLMS